MAKTLAQARQKPNNIGEMITTPPPVQNIPAVVPRELPGLAQATLGPAPAVWTTGYDSVKQFYRPGTSQQRFPPLPTKSNPQINAQAASVATTVVTAALAAQAMAGPDDETISTNKQTGTSYLTLMSDRDTLISMTNNSGGLVTLPGPTVNFGYVQTVSGITTFPAGSGPFFVSSPITNTVGNAMFAIVEGTLGTTITVGDSNANSWTLICSTGGALLYYATNIRGGSNKVTASTTTGSSGNNEVNLTVHEFSGVVPGGLDSFGIGSGSATLNIHFPNTVVIGAWRYDLGSSSTNVLTPGAGFTQMPPSSGLSWNVPPGPALFVNTLDEYEFNPPVGPSFAVVGAGAGISSYSTVAANFKTAAVVSSVMPAGWYTYIENAGAGSFVVQSTANIDFANQTITLPPNTGVLIVSDGVGYRAMRGVGTFVAANPYVVGGFVAGVYTASQDLMAIPVDRTVSFISDFGANADGSLSEATLQTAATSTTTFTINKIVAGVSTGIGLITFSAGSTVGVFTSTGHTNQSLVAGNVIQIVAPASPDATAASLGFTLSGTR